MPPGANVDADLLLLVHAPIGRDARLLHEVFGRAGLRSKVCHTVIELCHNVERGAGAVVVAEEALDSINIRALLNVLAKQEIWSDLPLIVLTTRGEPTAASHARLAALEPLGDLTFLERPLRSHTIVSAARAALRARVKQYEVRRRDAELQLVADNVPVLIGYIDRQQVYRRVNRTYYEWFGKLPGEVVGRTVAEVVGEPHCSASQEPFALALAGEQVCYNSQMCDKDDALREVLVSYAPDYDADGIVRGVVSLVQDLTTLKRAERDLEKHNQALRKANRELEEFAYVASHDLQEPLRMVNSYSQLLLRRLGPDPGVEFQQCAEYIRAGVTRMERLIRDLLSYSRAAHPDDSVMDGCADLQASLQQALTRLGAWIHEEGVELTVESLPVVAADEGQLSHVFQNLVSNALKYRDVTRPLQIRISTEHADGKCVISVRDNGIGFEQTQAERIFGLFKRLHNQDQYPGTGLGLAICKRIVERYGGSIWAESKVGIGSCFFISLPEGNHE